jgi:hypothetical protein
VSGGEVSRAWCAFVEGLVGSQSVVGVADRAFAAVLTSMAAAGIALGDILAGSGVRNQRILDACTARQAGCVSPPSVERSS